jgi:subtilisin family serine protease
VFVIDSGVNPAHSHVEHVAGGVRVFRGEGGGIHRDRLYRDEIGHGTAITAVIRYVAPGAEVFAVKIFGRTLTTTTDVLEGALEYAMRSRARIVNLSLAIGEPADSGRVGALCREAVRKGVILVAAASAGARRRGFPAILPEVIGATADARLGDSSIRYERDALFECRAAGWARPLPGVPRERNFSGHSFAAARVSGTIACLLEWEPRLELDAVRAWLDASYS